MRAGKKKRPEITAIIAGQGNTQVAEAYMSEQGKGSIAAKLEKFDAKQDARDSRLSLRKTNEEVIRITLRNEAGEKCKEYLSAMGKCAQENGLLVVFRCRAQNKAMSDCMDLHYNESIVEEHLLQKGYVVKK